MKYEDNSTHIGNKNKIKSSAIGQRSQVMSTEPNSNDRCCSHFFWKLFIPIAVIIIAAAICFWLGLK